MNDLKKRKYKVVLEEENCLNNWDLDSLSKFGVEENLNSHFEIKDGVLIQYVGKERDIIVPDGVVEIGIDAFKGCEKFNSIKISKSVEKISCVGSLSCLTEYLEVDKDNPKYYIQDGCLINREEKELVWAYSGTNIPEDGSVVKIGSKAFYHRSDLSRIVVPDIIAEIGDDAFGECNSLKEIVISDLHGGDAKRIFGRELKKNGDKWTFNTSSFFWF